jgi:hypothetical protein
LVSGALGRYTFYNDKEPDALEYYGGAIFELLDHIGTPDRIGKILDFLVPPFYLVAAVVFFKIAIWLVPSSSPWVTPTYVLAIIVWPLCGFVLFFLVVLPFRWLRIWARRGLCLLLARLACPVELGYYKMRNHARIDAKANNAAKAHDNESRTPRTSECEYGPMPEVLKRFSGEY